jgi:hypothetical protein
METMVLDTQRAGFVKRFMSETDENLLLKVIHYYEQLKAGMTVEPCQMTINELRTIWDCRQNHKRLKHEVGK